MGSRSTAVGYAALETQNFTTATNTFNTALGYYAGQSVTTGVKNVLIGGLAGDANTIGFNNIAVGYDALGTNTASGANVAIGYEALKTYNNTTEASHFNTTVGTQAGKLLQTGTYNTFLGPQAGFNVTTGSNNTIVGQFDGNNHGLDIRTSSNNIVLSDGSGNPRVTVGSTGHVDIRDGGFSIGTHSSGFNEDGVYISNSNGSFMYMERSGTGNSVMYLHRRTTDGNLIEFHQGNAIEGSISVSGNTVSYNGFCGTHDSTGEDVSANTPVGTVVSTVDEEYKQDHARIKVSDTVGDTRVYGVLQQFKPEEVSSDTGQTRPEHAVIASVGIGSVQVTGACSGGDLLESNGDGTAKVQSDDIIRSKTIGKVTIGDSNTGVKLVSCVLYCG